MLTRYAKLAYKFYFTSTVDFLIYFTHTTSNEYMRLNYTFFINFLLQKIRWLNKDKNSLYKNIKMSQPLINYTPHIYR